MPSGPGSSPRGRGKHADRTVYDLADRLIPARAGKTVPPEALIAAVAAHPRAGGENNARLRGLTVLDGSSPRGRGKPRTSSRERAGTGLIPARAGKTVTVQVSVASLAAHPRAGGENQTC